MTFKSAVGERQTFTTNGMVARVTTANANVDLFFKSAAMRGQDIVPEFARAYGENPQLALRIAQWLRDVRGGAGERQLFCQILMWLEGFDLESTRFLINKVPEIGRWDDLLVLEGNLKYEAWSLVGSALREGNGLCAKWMPRQGSLANQIASFLGYTPRQWRKLLVSLSKTVEQQMCANDWENINFSQVPSVASARYKRAFHKHATEAFGSYVEGLKNGTETVHAGAVYPYQVIQSMKNSGSATEIRFAEAQWNALPNYVGNVNILPMVDVSGSMGCPAGGSQAITCMDVAISLGLYLADKNTGTFKDLFLTFSATPEILHLSGDLYTKYSAMSESGWGMNTNLVGAMEAILNVATLNNVAQSEMPTHLLILSDMQFDQASNPNQTAMDMIEEKFLEAGYNVPAVVFWNLNAHDNVPVRFDEKGTALISGFSPAIMKSVLKMDVDSLSPISIMLDTILSPRYD